MEDRHIVLDAIADFHNKTCIKFIPRTTEKDFIIFKQVNGYGLLYTIVSVFCLYVVT